jgi:iron complex outermembrane receptor protein
MKAARGIALLAFSELVVWPTAALAQDSKLSEVTVYGERPAAFRNITTSTEAATAEIIDGTNVINTEDAVKYLPSIQIRKRYIGDRNAIVASRNAGTLDSARSLVYADNVLVSNLLGNSYAFAPRWWFVMPQEIERVDVSYGAHSAAYAGNAVGVVMVMKSRLPDRFEAAADAQAFRQNFKLYGTSESYEGSRLGAFLGNRHGDLRWTFGFNHFENDGHPQSFVTSSRGTTAAGAGDIAVTGYRWDRNPKNADRLILGATGMDHTVQDNAKVKLAYDFSPASRLTYTLGRWQGDSKAGVDPYLRDALGRPVYSGNVNIDGMRYTLAATALQLSRREEEHWMNSLAYRFDPKLGGDWAFEMAVTDYNIARDQTRKPTVALPAADAGGAGQIQRQDGTGWNTADVRADWRPQQGRLGHELAFGYHFDQHVLKDRTFDTANWRSGTEDALRSGARGKTETQAIYVQDAIRLGDDWQLTLGLRNEQWRAFAGAMSSRATTLAYADREENFISPKLALSWVASEHWLLRGALSRAVRFPTVTELFQGSVSGTSIINNDPNLKPEKILAGELAAERDIPSGSLRISLFQDNLEDALTRQTNTTVSPTVTNVQNVDKVRVRGVEASFNRRDVLISGLDLMGSVTYADSQILSNKKNPASVGKQMLRIPDWRATLAAMWHASDKLDLTLAARYSGRQYGELDNSDTHDKTFGGSSRFFVVDAKASFRIDRQLSVSVGVDNLNNERYYAYHPYTQRTWVAQLKYALR